MLNSFTKLGKRNLPGVGNGPHESGLGDAAVVGLIKVCASTMTDSAGLHPVRLHSTSPPNIFHEDSAAGIKLGNMFRHTNPAGPHC
jgi:hypothetical protein